MTTIRQTVESQIRHILPSGYSHIVNDIIASLEQREAALVDSLRAYASSRGMNTYEQDVLLSNAGLGEYVTVEEPEPEVPSDLSASAAMARLEETVANLEARLTAAAQRYGVSV